jgi:MraZ protein
MVFTGILWPIGVGTHLLVLPPRRFEVMVSKLEQMSLSDEHAAALERWLGSNSGELTFDSANRFTVPENLASQAGLADQAQYVGRLDKFEMWNPDRFEANQREDGAKLAAAVRQINL